MPDSLSSFNISPSTSFPLQPVTEPKQWKCHLEAQAEVPHDSNSRKLCPKEVLHFREISGHGATLFYHSHSWAEVWPFGTSGWTTLPRAPPAPQHSSAHRQDVWVIVAHLQEPLWAGRGMFWALETDTHHTLPPAALAGSLPH
jgi:hypothetical protein